MAVSPNGSTVFVTGDVGFDYGTIAYNASTGALLWVKLYTGVGTDNYAHSVAVSPSGSTVYVTGESDSASFVAQYATVAYNAATGAQLWAQHHGGNPGNDAVAYSVAVSPSGTTVYVTGTSAHIATFDYATVAYTASTGAQEWIKLYNGPGNGDDTAYSIAVSPTTGTVYVTGQAWAGSTPGDDYATVAYSG